MANSDVDTETYKEFTIRICHDDDPTSPRDNDNFGHMVCWHRRYKLGDEQPKEDPQDWHAAQPKGSIILPIIMYEHSGIALSTSRGGQFSDPWDSGQVGYIIATPEQIRANFLVKRITKRTREKAIEVLRSEVDEYSKYLGGETYGYIIEDPEGDQLDSCWGFIGGDYVRQEARAQVDYYASKRERKADIRDGSGL